MSKLKDFSFPKKMKHIWIKKKSKLTPNLTRLDWIKKIYFNFLSFFLTYLSKTSDDYFYNAETQTITEDFHNKKWLSQ